MIQRRDRLSPFVDEQYTGIHEYDARECVRLHSLIEATGAVQDQVRTADPELFEKAAKMPGVALALPRSSPRLSAIS